MADFDDGESKPTKEGVEPKEKASEAKKPEAQPEQQRQQWPLVYPLRKPIQANGEELSEIKLREPTGGDIARAGNPVILDMFSGEQVKITFDEKKMENMIGLLAAVPPSSVKQLHPRDWNSLAWHLVPFFTPDL